MPEAATRFHSVPLPDGVVDLAWAAATDTGRRARFYRLTRKGRAQLAAERESWIRLTLAVQSVMRS